MAYNTQFQFSFLEGYPETTQTVAQRRRVSFRRLNYQGEVIELLPRGEPFSQSFEDASDSRFVAILPSKVEIQLACQEYWQAQALYVDSDREVQVIVDLDTTGDGQHYEVDWVGWVLPQDLKEAFESKPYGVTVSAACGLSTLKERPLLDATGTRLKDIPTVSTVIRTALALADTVPGMVSGMNLFEEQDIAGGQTVGGLARPERDPLNRVKQDAASLVNDKNEALSAYDTLKKELEPFGCRVAQVKGQWFVIRADEAGGGWDKWNTANPATIHTRKYTQATPNVGPSSHASTDLNVYVGPGYPNKVLSGSTTWLENPKLGVRVEQTFGGFNDKLGNGSFAQVDSTGLPIGWRRKNVSDPNKARRFGTGTDEDPYRVRIYGSDYEAYIENETQGIDQQLHFDTGSQAWFRNQKVTRTLKGRFRLFNARGAKIVIRCSAAVGNTPPWWILQDGSSWKLFPKAKDRVGILILHDVLANNVDTPKPGWCDFSIKIPPVDFSGTLYQGINELNIMLCKPYTLEVYNSSGQVLGPVTTPEPYIEYADVELVEEDESVRIDGTQRTLVQKNKTAETVLTMTLGDVPDAAVATSRKNTLFKLQSGNVPTTRWYRPNANILDPNPAGDNVGKPLIDWNVESRARQNMYAALTFEGTIYGRLPHSIHSVLRIVGVGENDANGVFQLYPFQITRLTSRFRSMEHDVTAVRMMTGVAVPAGAAYTDVREWQTPDGTIVIDYDPTTSSPIEPTLPITLPPDVSIKKVIGALGLLPKAVTISNAPALFVPQDATDPQFSATGYSGGVAQGSVVSALRRITLFQPPK